MNERAATRVQAADAADIDAERARVTALLVESYKSGGGVNHDGGRSLPSRSAIRALVHEMEELLFPGFVDDDLVVAHGLADATRRRIDVVVADLAREIARELALQAPTPCSTDTPESCALAVLAEVPAIRHALALDVQAMLDGDPAARSREEIILAYPGIHAIAIHRVAHTLWQRGLKLVARMMSEVAHADTGIDIHPGATIGKAFYVDHGTGVVVGETTVIGDHVKIYQGVSLGALSVSKALQEKKRHPTIEDHVTIYAGATILGGETVVGHHSVIGGNVWLVKSVAPYSVVEHTASVQVGSRAHRLGQFDPGI